MTAVAATNLQKWRERVGNPLTPLNDIELRQLRNDVQPLTKVAEHAAEAYLLLGLGHAGRPGESADALADLRRSRLLNRHDWTAAYNIVGILMDEGGDEGEIETLLQEILKHPDAQRPHVLQLVAEMQMRSGQIVEAMRTFLEAASLCSVDEPDMYLRLAPLAGKWGMTIECVELLARWSIVTYPDVPVEGRAVDILRAVPEGVLQNPKLREAGRLIAYVMAFHPDTPASPLLGPRPGHPALTDHHGEVSSVAEQPSSEQSVDRVVAERLRSLAEELPGVSAIYLSPDAHQFAVTGDLWSEALDEAPAALATALTFDVFPNEPGFEGYYQQNLDQAPAGWRQVFP